MLAGATISTDRPERSGGARAARRCRRPRGSGDDGAEARALARRAVDLDAAAHPLDDAPRDRKAEAGAAELAGRAGVGLLELVEDAGLLLRRDADAGVANLEHDLAGARPGLDHDADAAGLGELDGIAGEIEQHLAEPRGVADDARGQPLVDVGGDLQALGLRARAEQLDDVLDQAVERERLRLEFELAGLDLGEIENLLDQRQQRVAGRLGGLDVGGLLRGERRVVQKTRPCRGCRSAACGSHATPWRGSATWRRSRPRRRRAPRPARARPRCGR